MMASSCRFGFWPTSWIRFCLRIRLAGATARHHSQRVAFLQLGRRGWPTRSVSDGFRLRWVV